MRGAHPASIVFLSGLLAAGCSTLVAGDADEFPDREGTCGDGIVQSPEECDRGAANGEGSGCSEACRIVSDPCEEEGARQCVSPTVVQICSGDAWKVESDCAVSGRFCGAGECVDVGPCLHVGTTACAGSVLLSCKDGGWRPGSDCAARGERCLDGACVPVGEGEGEGEGESPTLYVRAGSLAPWEGTEAHPFDTIAAALLVAEEGFTIEVASGFYRENVVLATASVTLRGAGRETTDLRGNGQGPAVEITGQGSRVEGISVDANSAPVGVRLECEPCTFADSEVTMVRSGADEAVGVLVHRGEGARVTGVAVSDVSAASGPAAGILVRRGQDVHVEGNQVTAVTAGAPEGETKPASGILLESTRTAVVTGNTVDAVTGGMGRQGEEGGWSGGTASGIWLSGSLDSVVTANTITGVVGGRGNMPGPPANFLNGGKGGNAVGVRLTEAVRNTLEANVVADLVAGTPGVDLGEGRRWGAPGTTYGFHLGPNGLNNTLATTNTYDGDAVVYLYGADGGLLADHELTADANTTNLGKIVVIASSNVVVRDNEVRGVVGESGETGRVGLYPSGDTGFEGTGILIRDSDAVELTGNVVYEITGGRGGSGGYFGNGGRGGDGVGVWLQRSTGVRLVGNVVQGISGGARGDRYDTKSLGPRGHADGIRIDDSDQASSGNDLVFDITTADGGGATGIWIVNASEGALVHQRHRPRGRRGLARHGDRGGRARGQRHGDGEELHRHLVQPLRRLEPRRQRTGRRPGDLHQRLGQRD